MLSVGRIAVVVKVLIFVEAASSEVLVPNAERLEGTGHSRLKAILPDVTFSRGTGHQRETCGSSSSLIRATDRAEI